MRLSRDWATPLTIGAFALMATTGLLMFFHLDTGLNKLAHEWLGWVMVAGVALHATVNWAALKRHLLANRAGQALVGLSLVVLAASFASPPGGERRGESPPMLALRAVLRAPLRDIAPLAGQPAEALQARLRAGGIVVEQLDQPLDQVAAGDRDREARILNLLFGAVPVAPGERP